MFLIYCKYIMQGYSQSQIKKKKLDKNPVCAGYRVEALRSCVRRVIRRSNGTSLSAHFLIMPWLAHTGQTAQRFCSGVNKRIPSRKSLL